MALNYKTVSLLCFSFAVGLRLLLWWCNPPQNAFDDHFEPIFMIMNTGAIPDATACWQCYHPPVFYWVSAMIGKAALNIGADQPQLMKLLQFLPCLYGILTVGLVYLILARLPLSNFSRFVPFSAVCFLPRHIYMSAMNSNDSMSYLFVALSVYLLLVAIRNRLSPPILALVSLATAITLFTKFTAYIMLPALAAAFASLHFRRAAIPGKKVLASFIMTLLLPASLLSIYLVSNTMRYSSPLPWNVKNADPSFNQPKDTERLDFLSFKPWDSINSPILVPGKIHSFWTMVYGGMWYDNEPKFLVYLDRDLVWWKHYLYGWINGVEKYPGDNPSMKPLTKAIGSGLVVLGLFPLSLIFTGIYRYVSGRQEHSSELQEADHAKLIIFPALLISNVTGIVALAIRLPVFSAAKASYFLCSLPAFAVFIGLGAMSWERTIALKYTILTVTGLIGALVILHILQIAQALL